MPARSPRVQVCFAASELAELRVAAAQADLPLSAYLRLQVLRARRLQGGREPDLTLASLAGLVAAEHALTLLEAVLPDGARRSIELREDAVRAAAERLESLREQVAGGWSF